MIYKIIEEGNDTLKIRKKEFKGHSDTEWGPPKDERLGKIFSNGRGKKDVDDFLEVDVENIPIFPEENPMFVFYMNKNMPIFDEDNPKERFFQKKTGWIKTNGGYVKVLQTRKSAVAAIIAAILAAILLVLSLLLGVAPKDLPKYLADQAGITHNNTNQKASIKYATYLSTENTTWKAGVKEQDITLALPKETSYKGKNG